VWAVGPLVSGTTVYRMSEFAIQHQRTLGGTTSCSPTCPGSPIYHVANEQAAWKVNGVMILGNSATSGHVLPSANVNVSSVANLDDPFLCFFESDVCLLVAETETVSCSQVGSLMNNSGKGPPQFVMEYAGTLFGGGEQYLSPTRSRYYLSSNCLNPPDFQASMLPGPPPGTYVFLPFRRGFFLRMLLFSYNGGSTWARPSGAQPIYVEDYTMAENPIYCTQYPNIY
jgi:hypothetical protein